MKSHSIAALLAAGLVLNAATPLSAATLTWDGGDAVNNNWSDADNWTGLTGAQANDALVFPAGPGDKATVNNLAAGTVLASLQFTGNSYSVSGNAFALGAGGVTMNVSGPGAASLQPPVSLRNTQTWQVATPDDVLTASGMVTSTGSGLTVTGSGLVSLAAGYSGAGALTLNMTAGSGGGLRFLPGSSSDYTGATSVLSGVLQAGGNISASAVSVSSGGTLGGEGTVHSAFVSGGAIQPGRAAGSPADNAALLAILHGLTCSCGQFQFNIDGTSQGTTYDQIRVNGAVQLGGAGLSVSLDSGYLPPPGTSFTLLSNDGTDAVAGTFAGLPNGAPVMAGGRGFVIFYNGGDGNDVVLTAARTWTGAGGSAFWSNPANWDGTSAPVQGDYLVFPDLGAPYSCSNDLVPGRMYGSIAVAGDVTSVAGNEIGLQRGITAVAGSFSWDTELKLLGFQSFTGLASRIFVHKVNLNGVTLIMDCMTAGASDSVSVSGDAGGDLYGSGSIIARGPGKKYLGGANSYTGLTSVEDGILDLQRSSSLGAASSPCVVAAGAQLAMTTTYVTVVPNPITLSGSLFVQGPGVQTFSGPLTLDGAPAVIASNATGAVLSGPVGGSGSLSKSGTGILTLSGSASNTFTGGCTVAQGDVVLDKNAGAVAIPGTITLGFGVAVSALRQLRADQFAPGAQVQLGPKGVFNPDGHDCSLAALELTGGIVTGTPGRISLTGGLTAHAHTQTAIIAAGLFSTSALGTWNVEDGAADPDIDITVTTENAGVSVVQKTGAGTLRFTGSQLLQRLTVSAGEVAWNATGPTSLRCDGGTITGNGSCGLLTGLAGGGFVSPGSNGPALLTCTSLSLPASTTVKFDLGGSTPGTGSDQIITGGQPVLNNPALQLIVTPGFTAAPGGEFVIVKNNSPFFPGGTFAGLPEGKHLTAGSQAFRITYQGGGGKDIALIATEGKATITAFTATPGYGPNDDQNNVLISATGAYGLSYALEASSDLAAWTTIAQTPAAPAGTLGFQLLDPPNSQRRFFRIRRL